MSGKSNLTVQFDEELWIPVWMPCSSKTVKISIIHSEFAAVRSIVIAAAQIEIGSIPKVESEVFTHDAYMNKRYGGPRLRWIHFYGANTTVKTGKNAELMNKYPSLGISYRGSLLAAMRLLTEPGTNPECVRVRHLNYIMPKTLMPIMTTYYMRVMFYQGTSFDKARFNKWSASVSIGNYELKVLGPTLFIFYLQ